ncbi:MAG: LPS export ABC transporter periplasmic protein LptC [Candidatus Omnitrophota bacterium]
MIRKMLITCILFALLYAGLVHIQFVLKRGDFNASKKQAPKEELTHKVYSFSFSKYGNDGEKELEIEGDSANVLTRTVNLINIVAKAYAEETPVTITADTGYYDKDKEKVFLHQNVVATTEDGTRLLTEELEIHPGSKSLETVQLAEVKKDNINIDGLGARGDSALKKVQFKKKVKVVVQDPENPDVPPTVITCEGPLDIDYERNIAHFVDNVVAVDSRGTLTADKMDVYYNKEHKRVSKIIATGNVVVENPDGNKTYSDSVIYLAEEGRIILGGDTEALYYGGEAANLPKEFQ